MALSSSQLQTRLERLSGKSLYMRINNNISNLLSVSKPSEHMKSRGDFRVKVSINHLFLDAPREVIEAVGTFIRGANRKNRMVIRRFINENYHRIKVPKEMPLIKVKGRYVHLSRIFRQVNRDYFKGKLRLKVSWAHNWGTELCPTHTKSRQQTRRRRKTLRYIQFATYDERLKLIRVNPRLDNQHVPDYFIRYILYHEMLHAVLPSRISSNGRLFYHTPEFHRREKEFKDYDRAREWEQKSFTRI